LKIVTTEQLDGKKLEMIGVVRGSTVQTRNIGRDILGGLKTIVGGEIRAYSEMMDKAVISPPNG
jgi:uncharacterized protein YbjQ (UPF0145 family)